MRCSFQKNIIFITDFKLKMNESLYLPSKTKENHIFAKILVNERKEVSENENTMLNAWIQHRRHSLEECRDQLSSLTSITIDKNDVDQYIDH